MFIVLIKILVDVNLNYSSFWPSADVKPVSNVSENAMSWQCMFPITMCMQWSLCCLASSKPSWKDSGREPMIMFFSPLKTAKAVQIKCLIGKNKCGYTCDTQNFRLLAKLVFKVNLVPWLIPLIEIAKCQVDKHVSFRNDHLCSK